MIEVKVATAFDYAAHNEATRVRLIQMRIGKEIELRVARANLPYKLIRGGIGILDRMLWQMAVRSITDGNQPQVMVDLTEMKKQLGIIRSR
jgi:hypothetical protein